MFRPRRGSVGGPVAAAGCQQPGGGFAASSHPGHNGQEMRWGTRFQLQPAPQSRDAVKAAEEPSTPRPGPWEWDRGGCPGTGRGPTSSRAGCQLCTHPRAPNQSRKPAAAAAPPRGTRTPGRLRGPPGERGGGGGEDSEQSPTSRRRNRTAAALRARWSGWVAFA